MKSFYPDSINKIPNNIEVKGIVVHHSVSGEKTTLEDLHTWHVKDRGFNAIGYHVVIFRDGTTVQTRPFDKCGAHCEVPSGFGPVGPNGLTKSWNHYGLGVCFIGDFRKDTVTTEQWQSFSDLCHILFKQFNLSENDITWHRKASGGKTECPGSNLIKKLENIELFPEGAGVSPKHLSEMSLLELVDELSKRIHANYVKN